MCVFGEGAVTALQFEFLPSTLTFYGQLHNPANPDQLIQIPSDVGHIQRCNWPFYVSTERQLSTVAPKDI